MKKYLFLAITLLCLSCESKGEEPQQSQMPQPQTPELLATGFQFTEGPTWCADGYLLFSDIYGNKIYKWNESEGLSTFLTPAENSNGIFYDGSQFWVCRHGARDIAKLSKEGMITSFINSYNGNRLNSPNDITVSKQGAIYFTDPDYGVQAADRELDFEGLYYVVKGSSTATLVDNTMIKPNGVALSPDNSKLYVCESSTNNIYIFDIDSGGMPTNKRTLCKIAGSGEVDGIACHKSGYLFVAFSTGGVVMLSAEGEQVDNMTFAQRDRIRNVCIGGSEENILFVAAGQTLYRVIII